MKKKRKIRRLFLVLLIIVLLLAALAAVSVLTRKKEGSALLPSNITTEQAHIGTIRLTTEGNGFIEPADDVLVSSDYTMKIDTVEVENGDIVAAGDVIATVDPDSLDEQISQLENQLSEINSSISGLDDSGSSDLTSPVTGRIKRIFARPDEYLEDIVADHGGLMEISADGKLKIIVKSDRTLKPGDEVTVSFLSYEVDGTVQSADHGEYTIIIDDNSSYQVDTEATVTDENGVLVGSGYLASNHPYLVDGTYGIVDEITVDIGDHVDAGATLLTRRNYTYNGTYLNLLENRQEVMEDLQDLRTLQRSPRITAGGDGILSDLALMEQTVTAEDSPMYRLISTDRFWLKAEIDELDIAGVAAGQTASIVFDAFDTETYEGTVEKVSALGTNTGGVTRYTVTIAVPGMEKLKTSMSATATIVTDQHENALIVPVDAVQTDNGQSYVTVVEGDEQRAVPVTLGLVNNTEAEILEGLSEGDIVTVVGKTDFEKMMDMMEQSRAEFRGGDN